MRIRYLKSMLCALLAFTMLLSCSTALALEEAHRPEAPAATPAPEKQEPEIPWDENTYTAPRTKPITGFERKIVEQGLRLVPYDHPFVIAYERTYNVQIDSYVTEKRGVTVSGVPFDFGGKGDFKGFNDIWWDRSGVSQYPVQGLDCAKYLSWIYYQLGYQVPTVSTALFFAGQTGVERNLPGIRAHKVLRSMSDAMIGDICYNSEKQNYRSGHGSHVQMYLGTANILGIANELEKMYPDFPMDAHLVLDCGWSDGDYYYKKMRALKVPNPRRGMAGTGVAFFTSVKSGSTYLYRSPKQVYKWENPATGNTFKIESRLEANGRLLQYKPKSKVQYPINISRPISRPDA